MKKPLFPVDIGDIFDENYQVASQFSKICVPRAPRRALRFLTPSPWRKRVHVAKNIAKSCWFIFSSVCWSFAFSIQFVVDVWRFICTIRLVVSVHSSSPTLSSQALVWCLDESVVTNSTWNVFITWVFLKIGYPFLVLLVWIMFTQFLMSHKVVGP